MIILQPRTSVPVYVALLVPLISVLATLIAGGLIFAVLGYAPLPALYEFFIAPLSRPDQFGNLLVKACPLIIIGTGLVFCYRANIWNIGAEGQLTMGAIFGGGIGLLFNDSTSVFLLPLMILFGAIGGAFWATIPAILKTKFNTNEILTSLM